mmetsp:Transcript_70221/g.152639  ORF Transcript_70221/g.152639 Transcript_70221/m.152639 type:complete len:317 (-) Transcript_70221:93-1043(-)
MALVFYVCFALFMQPGLSLLQSLDQAQATNLTDETARVQILSMGRVGSTFTLDLFAQSGYPTLAEPLWGLIEGSRMLEVTPEESLTCMYTCDPCSSFAMKEEALQDRQDYCDTLSDQTKPLVIKDIRMLDPEGFVALPLEVRTKTKFILLLRDPRGVWESLMPYYTWAIHSIPLICEELYLEASTVPRLRQIVGDENVLVASFEEWSQDLEGYVAKLMNHVNGSVSQSVLEYIADKADPAAATRWLEAVSESDLTEIEVDENCKKYMEIAGYKTGPESTDYSALTNLVTLPLSDERMIRLRQDYDIARLILKAGTK